MSYEQADLTNCDREPIHLLGNIQDYGALLAFGYDWQCLHASSNVQKFLTKPVEDVLGSKIYDLISPDSFTKIKELLNRLNKIDQTERLFCIELFDDEVLYDLSVHLSDNIIVIEIEYHQALVHQNSLTDMRTALRNLSKTYSLESFFIEGTETVAEMTGFGRVMLYRFHNDGSGEVIAETIKSGMESFYGLRYPASDIPKQARKLYTRNITRQIENRHYYCQAFGAIDKSHIVIAVISQVAYTLEFYTILLYSLYPSFFLPRLCCGISKLNASSTLKAERGRLSGISIKTLSCLSLSVFKKTFLIMQCFNHSTINFRKRCCKF